MYNTYIYITYTISKEEVTITGCDARISGGIIIPETIEGYPVTTVGEFAFYDCRNLKSVKFCSVPQINWDAFANTNIREVVLTEELSHNTEFRYDLRNILGRQIRFAVEEEEEME